MVGETSAPASSGLKFIKTKRRIYDEENPEQCHPVTKKVKDKESRLELPVNNRYSLLSKDEVQPMQEGSRSDEDFQLRMKQNSIQKEKTHAFVLEGLDNEPDVEEIKEEMKATHQICVKQIYKMKNTRRPLYLVITGVKYGDMTPSCNAKPVCLKCAKGHFTLECHLKQEEVPKCVNCGGNHPANNIQCPVYINIVKTRKLVEAV
ncbi:hypothetical protein HHI36_024344 [Cryptolaemus montrouzieri]|uniref:Pre-C2HC domain-containing protein n=1 Tax=Cryptolaemus montrouzieri TaxID=559131 RepID=A0ABD2NC36_9CUCU